MHNISILAHVIFLFIAGAFKPFATIRKLSVCFLWLVQYCCGSKPDPYDNIGDIKQLKWKRYKFTMENMYLLMKVIS